MKISKKSIEIRPLLEDEGVYEATFIDLDNPAPEKSEAVFILLKDDSALVVYLADYINSLVVRNEDERDIKKVSNAITRYVMVNKLCETENAA